MSNRVPSRPRWCAVLRRQSHPARGLRAASDALIAVLLAAAAPTHASQGILEINQACAAGPGCFAGDVPGFPVTITAAGSYRLTGNLDVPSVSNGIEITTGYVSLDLGGFAIQGPNSCPGTPAVCTLPAGTNGISVLPGVNPGVEVRNGRVQGMAGTGISLGSQCVVRNVAVAQNRVGLSIGSGCLLWRVSAVSNGTEGIRDESVTIAVQVAVHANGGSGALVKSGVWRDVVAAHNGSRGLGDGNPGSATVFTNVTADSNGAHGVSCGICVTRGSTARGNGGSGFDQFFASAGFGTLNLGSSAAQANGADGIHASGQLTVTECAARLNAGDGIETGEEALVLGNTTSDNTGVGLRLGEDSAYRENAVTSNTAGTVVGVGNFQNTTGNLCTDAADNAVACP